MKIWRHCRANQRGSTLTFTCILLIALLAFTALAVDIGYLYFVKADLQAVADSAALAGASALGGDAERPIVRAQSYAHKNKVNGSPVTLHAGDVQLGLWDSTARVFTPANPSAEVEPNAVRVTPWLSQVRGNPVKLFFGGVVGYSTMDVKASATATFFPRDAVVVLDFSASMCYDSRLRRAATGQLLKEEVEENIRNMWAGTGIDTGWGKDGYGSRTFGTMTFDGVTIARGTSDQAIMNMLHLNDVPYPYPEHSYTCTNGNECIAGPFTGKGWPAYFHYVQCDSPDKVKNTDGKVERIMELTKTEYRDRYGYLTLLNYWQDEQFKANQTHDLWKTAEQPVTCVKDGLDVFLAFIQMAQTDDRVGLAMYTSADNTAKLEQPLTNDFNLVSDTARHLQAGHYNGETNIAAGIATGLAELKARGRTGAFQFLVLLSDGKANRLDDGTGSESAARAAAVTQARAAADAGVVIVTISLGVDADVALMQEIADITRPPKGVHFVVPGGQTVESVRDQLMAVFASIAAQAPLRLVD